MDLPKGASKAYYQENGRAVVMACRLMPGWRTACKDRVDAQFSQWPVPKGMSGTKRIERQQARRDSRACFAKSPLAPQMLLELFRRGPWPEPLRATRRATAVEPAAILGTQRSGTACVVFGLRSESALWRGHQILSMILLGRDNEKHSAALWASASVYLFGIGKQIMPNRNGASVLPPVDCPRAG